MFFRQPIITSLLVDDSGLVQGYRVVTDPRAPVAVRQEAHTLFAIFKGKNPAVAAPAEEGADA